MDDVCRQGIVERIDRRLAFIVAASLVLHAAGVLALKSVDRAPGNDEVVVAPAPVFAPIVHANVNVNVNANANANANGNGKRRRHLGTAVPRASLSDEVRRLGALKTLTARGGEAGEVRDLLARGSAPIDSDEALGRAAGVTLGGGDDLRVRGEAVGRTRSGGALRAGGPGEVETGGRAAERTVAAQIDVGPLAPPAGAPDAAALAVAIKQRLGALRACWERSLRVRGGGAGKLVLKLDVTALGDVEDAVVEHDGVGDPALVRCVRERARAWRLPSLGKRFVFSFPVVLIAR